jgi:lipid II:glycine glycyltransferase (peptidoglycan interpeptide bridge formation enzyme)
MPAGFSMHYAPRGPVLNGHLDEWSGLWRALRRRLFQEGGVVLRVDPEWTDDEGLRVLRAAGADPANPVQHQATALIDLRRGEEVFARMSPSARRNIRKAERAGVRIIRSDSRQALEQLYLLLAETGLRKGFAVRTRSYYSDILEIFGRRGMASVYLACHEGQAVAGSLMVSYGSKLIYLFSGSTDRGLDLKAAYLLQQQAIRDAQSAGLTTYDLWGIPLESNKDHPGWGYSHFKEMLGGEPVRFIGSFDIPVSKPMAIAFHLAERATNYNASFV